MIGSWHGDFSGALLEGPLDSGVVDDPEGIKVVLGDEFARIAIGFRLFQTSKHIMGFSDGDNGMSGAGRRKISCLFDLLPGYWRGLR